MIEGEGMQDQVEISGLAGIALEVVDLDRSARFYTQAWGMEQVSAEPGQRHLRCVAGAPVALTLKQGARPRFASLTLAVRHASAMQAVYERMARTAGVRVAAPPGPLGADGQGGHGFMFEGPQGLRCVVAAGSEVQPSAEADPSRPLKLTHVVLNSADVPELTAFFVEVLGFRVSDRTALMDFLRCGGDHHTVALAHGNGLSLNHAAFEMRDIDSLMRGTGRLLDHGVAPEWGLGRHGPGNNVFNYFVDPDGFAVEYTTEMDQVGEHHVEQDAAYWNAFPRRPCRWGVARKPSDRLMKAFEGRDQAPAFPQ